MQPKNSGCTQFPTFKLGTFILIDDLKKVHKVSFKCAKPSLAKRYLFASKLKVWIESDQSLANKCQNWMLTFRWPYLLFGKIYFALTQSYTAKNQSRLGWSILFFLPPVMFYRMCHGGIQELTHSMRFDCSSFHFYFCLWTLDQTTNRSKCEI